MRESSNDLDLHVGKRLRQARKGQRLTQDCVAAALGVTMQQVQKYECAQTRLSVARLYAASQFLGRPVSWFLAMVPFANPATVRLNEPA